MDKYRALLDVAAEEFASSDRDMTLLSGVYFVNYQGSWKMDGEGFFLCVCNLFILFHTWGWLLINPAS